MIRDTVTKLGSKIATRIIESQNNRGQVAALNHQKGTIVLLSGTIVVAVNGLDLERAVELWR